MQHVKHLIGHALSAGQPAAPVEHAPRSVDPATAEVINKLFAELQCIFPAWRQAWPDDRALASAKRSWIKAFMAAGISSLGQIRFGLEQCRLSGSDFAPSAGRFIAWCRPTPEMLGLPSEAVAYKQACRAAYPGADHSRLHPAVYHAACETGFYELQRLSEDKSRKLFERAYALTVKALLAGEPLREIPKALPETVSVRTEAAGRSGIAAARAALRGAL